MKKVRVLAGVAGVVPVALATATATTTPAAAAPVIQKENCSGTQAKTWFHLATTYHGWVCFGRSGFSSPKMYAGTYCPGNNFGAFVVRTPGGVQSREIFSPGLTGFHGTGPYPSFDANRLNYILTLSITSWAGNNAC